MHASSLEVSCDDAGLSHTKALQEKVLTKEQEIADILAKRTSKAAKFSP